jgi:hypothetical protein
MLDIADSVAFFTAFASGAPDQNDDSADSGSNGTFRAGDQWFDQTSTIVYVCLDATVGAAVWLSIRDTDNLVTLDDFQIVSNKTLFSPNFDGVATWRDNDKANFGDNSDLQIYHDGTSSRIRDVGPGDLRIEGSNIRIEDFTTDDNFIICVSGGGLDLRFANDVKLVTVATGVDITGNITVSGDIRHGTGDVLWTSGTGTPEGVVTAVVGSMFTRTDGGANTTLYVKESGSGNTGWIAK